MKSSAMGALNTRFSPNSCCMPFDTLKMPPFSLLAMSWPQMKVSGLSRNSSLRVWLRAAITLTGLPSAWCVPSGNWAETQPSGMTNSWMVAGSGFGAAMAWSWAAR